MSQLSGIARRARKPSGLSAREGEGGKRHNNQSARAEWRGSDGSDGRTALQGMITYLHIEMKYEGKRRYKIEAHPWGVGITDLHGFKTEIEYDDVRDVNVIVEEIVRAVKKLERELGEIKPEGGEEDE